MRIGFLASHPIQYLAPLLRELATRVDLHVFYAHDPSPQQQAAAGFDVAFEWDTDLLGGYNYTFLKNQASNPDAREGQFFGCDTPAVYDEITAGRFDVFIVNGWYLKAFWQAVWACKRASIPVLARGDSQLGAQPSRVKALVKRIVYRIMLRAFYGFLSVGQRFDTYLQHYGISQERIFRAPHCVDNAWFAQQAQKAHEDGTVTQLRETYSGDGRPVLLFVGKFIPKKRPLDFVEGVALLERGGFPVTGVCVGSGPLEAEARALAKELDCAVHFSGFQNQGALPAYYAMADALVLPSDGTETWGLVVNEALACGTPAIVSEAAGCAPDLIVDGKTGYTYPVGDTEVLAQVVKQLMTPRNSPGDFSTAVTRHIAKYAVSSAADHIVEAARVVAEKEIMA